VDLAPARIDKREGTFLLVVEIAQPQFGGDITCIGHRGEAAAAGVVSTGTPRASPSAARGAWASQESGVA
jgi:hypothetical protein